MGRQDDGFRSDRGGDRGPPSPPPAAKEPKKEAAPEAPKPEVKAEVAKVETPAPVEEDPLGWLGVKLSPRLGRC